MNAWPVIPLFLCENGWIRFEHKTHSFYTRWQDKLDLNTIFLSFPSIFLKSQTPAKIFDSFWISLYAHTMDLESCNPRFHLNKIRWKTGSLLNMFGSLKFHTLYPIFSGAKQNKKENWMKTFSASTGNFLFLLFCVEGWYLMMGHKQKKKLLGTKREKKHKTQNEY